MTSTPPGPESALTRERRRLLEEWRQPPGDTPLDQWMADWMSRAYRVLEYEAALETRPAGL